MRPPVYPMSALVGLDDLVLALVLCAVDPKIGGVLLRGDKGSAKTTAARALAGLLPDGAPFVEVPLGATEDRVVGSVDVAAILSEGEHRFFPGLLQAAHGGVLYVDEVNLLADHLVDVLLDAAATGTNRVERDGVSHAHDSRFVLVGSMNPEEGELRPQLLDRFGLSVSVRTPEDPDARAEAVRRRLAFDADPAGFAETWAAAERALATRISSATPAPLEPGLVEQVAQLCVAAGAEGLRADLVICRAASARAGWRGTALAGPEDVAAVAPLALAHRRRTPFSAPPHDPADLDEIVERTLRRETPVRETPAPPDDAGAGAGADERTPPGGPGEGDGDGDGQAPPGGPGETPPLVGLLERRRRGSTATAGRRRAVGEVSSARGRAVRSEPLRGRTGAIDARGTVVAAAVRGGGGSLDIGPEDLHALRREPVGGTLVVLAVDTSGSMGAAGRVALARGAVLSLVADAYQRRDRVAVVTYRDRGATVVLRPTSSTEVAAARLAELETGGRTPLAAGIDAARSLALEERRRGAEPLLVLVTDGRATWATDGRDPLQAALDAGAACRAAGIAALVVDCEAGARALGVSRLLADAMGGRYVPMGEVAADAGETLAAAISSSLG